MRILFDVAHPAHVHQFVPIARELIARGHVVRMVGRDKDVTCALLEASGLPFEVPAAPPGPRRTWRDARELVMRVRALRRIVRHWRPDVLLTRNPAGALAGFGTPTQSVFDTDDGRQVGIHYWLARPFADVITSSVHDPEDHGRRHRRYPGFKALTYLHPDRFRPDPAIRPRLGVPDGPLFVVRFSAHDASHDRHIDGIAAPAQDELLRLLRSRGTVVLAREGAPTVVLGGETERPLRAADLHHVLAHSDLCVGDSQTVAVEAALLGVPTIRLSGFTGRHFTLDVLERDHGLVRNLRPGEEALLLREVETALADLEGPRSRHEAARALLLAEATDPVPWVINLCEHVAGSR